MDKAPPQGTVVVWEPKNFNPDYWNNLSEADRVRSYAWAGYGQKRPLHRGPKCFVFICPIIDPDGYDSGHCVLLDLDDGHLEHMRHTCELRLATAEEF